MVVRPEGYVGLVPARSDSELVLAAALSLSLRDTRENVLEMLIQVHGSTDYRGLL